MQLEHCQSDLSALEDECAHAIEELENDIKELREEVEEQRTRANYFQEQNQALNKERSGQSAELWARADNNPKANPNSRKGGDEEEARMQQLIAKFNAFHHTVANSSVCGHPQAISEPKGPELNLQSPRWTGRNESPCAVQDGHGRAVGGHLFLTENGQAEFALIEMREHKKRRIDDSADMRLLPQLPGFTPDDKGKGRAIDS